MLTFLKQFTSWSNAGLGLIKICATCFGLSVGIMYYQELALFLPVFMAVFGATAFVGVALWIKKTRSRP